MMEPHGLPPKTINELSATSLDPNGDAIPVRTFSPTKFDIWTLGITIGLGGQYFSWNSGLRAGLYTYLIDFIVVGMAYITLCCCTSEISGALPFAGGAYGLSRCTLGYYVGFLVGCVETCEYIAYVSTSVMSLANMLVEGIPALKGFEPLIWLFVYGHACYVHYRGDYFFWRWNRIVGMASFLILMMYVFGSIPHVDFANNADVDPNYRFVNGISGFIKSMPVACWFFVGVEALSLASDDVKNPQHEIPFAQVRCISTLSSIGIVVFFVTVSLPPAGLNQVSKLLAPLDNGFHNMFNIPLDMSTLFSIPAMYATSFGFMWGYGKLISAMATSKLLPPSLARKSDKYDTPINAVIFGTVISYFFSLVVYFVPTIETYLYNVCIAAAFLGYASQCLGYISIKRYYPALKESEFKSPFGIAGAVYSLFVWCLGLVSIAFYQDQNGVEVVGFAILIFLFTVFYLVYAKQHQTFSEQESKVFLMAYVMKLGRRKHSKSNLMEKNPARRRFRHINPKHTPVVYAEPLAGDLNEVRLTSAVPLRLGRFASTGVIREENKPLELPVAKWIPEATPFYRYFSDPQAVYKEFELKMAAAKRAEATWTAVVNTVAERYVASAPTGSYRLRVTPGVVTPAKPRLSRVDPLSKRMIAFVLNEGEQEEKSDDDDFGVRTPVEATEAEGFVDEQDNSRQDNT